MAEIKIYDSEGNPLEQDDYSVSERIQDFFFSGVRVVIDTTGGQLEIVCFFRARESEASRSEQYYAVFKSRRVRDAGQFGDVVRERVEDELGLMFDTSTEDTTIFKLLLNNENPPSTLPQQDVDDILDLIGTGEQAKIGASTYRDAFAVLRDFARQKSRGKYAIVENASGSRLSQFDLVIEKGSYAGAEIFEETKQSIEAMKKRRLRLQEGVTGHEESSSKPDVFLVVAVIGIIGGIVVLATIFLCHFEIFAVPFLSETVPSCGVELTINDATSNGERIAVAGELTKYGEPVEGSVTMNMTIREKSERFTIPVLGMGIGKNISKKESKVIHNVSNGSKGFNFTVRKNTSIGNNSFVMLKYNGTKAEKEITIKNQIPTPTPTATPTPTPTATPTPTPTATPSQNQTATSGNATQSSLSLLAPIPIPAKIASTEII